MALHCDNCTYPISPAEFAGLSKCPRCGYRPALKEPRREQMVCPKPGSIWAHRKGGTYLVLCVARVEATLEHVVVYHKVRQPSDAWTRPVAEFMDGRFVEKDRLTEAPS